MFSNFDANLSTSKQVDCSDLFGLFTKKLTLFAILVTIFLPVIDVYYPFISEGITSFFGWQLDYALIIAAIAMLIIAWTLIQCLLTSQKWNSLLIVLPIR